MRKFSGAFGLRGHERVVAGLDAMPELRWSIPLPRAAAQLVRDRIEQTPATYRDRVVPRRASSIEEYEASFADAPSGRVGYMPGGSYASLRRMLLVDTKGPSVEEARRRAARALDEMGLGTFAEEPTAEEITRHVRAVILSRVVPAVFAKVWADAEVWPPSAADLEAIEAAIALDPQAYAAARVVSDRVNAFVVLQDRALGRDVQPPALFIGDGDVMRVATICERGVWAARWLLLGFGQRPRGLVGMEDLKSFGAAYVATKVLLPRRIGTFVESSQEYTIVFSGAAFDRLERFTVDRDALGSLAPLAEALSDEQLITALRSETLSSEVEILFPDGLSPALVLGVVCRTAESEAELLQVLEGLRIRVRTVVSDRYPSL